MHLDEVRPGRRLHVPADAPATGTRAWLLQAEGPADRRVQPVGGGEIACPPLPGAHRRRVLADLTDFVVANPHAGADGSVEKRAVQHGSAYAATGGTPEWRVDASVAVLVADPPERLAVGMHAEMLQVPQRVWHQALTAGLVDRSAALFDDDCFQSGLGAVDRGGQSGRAT